MMGSMEHMDDMGDMDEMEETEDMEEMEDMEDMEEEMLPEVGNKICPVSGEKVGEMGDIVQIEYNGKIYNLCCAMCKKDFLENPEKYSKIAEEEVMQNKMEGHEHMEEGDGYGHMH